MADIPINDEIPRARYTAAGGETSFDYSFPIFDADHLLVQMSDPDDLDNPVTLERGTDYDVTGVGLADGGTVDLDAGEFPTGAEADFIFTITRQMPLARLNDFQFSGDFESTDVNTDMDANVMMIQQVNRDAQASIRLNATDVLTTLLLKVQATADRMGRSLRFSDDGLTLESGATEDEIANAQDAAEDAVAAQAATQDLANDVALASTQIQAYVDAIADILDGLSGQFGQIVHQVFTSGFTAGVSTTLTLTTTPLPTSEDQFDVYMYGTVGNGIRISSDNYTYSAGVITFSGAIPAGTTKIEVLWVTTLSIGVPAANSVNWLTNMVNTAGSKIAAWASDGTATLLDFVTAITGTPSDTQIPTEKAVKDYVDDAIDTAIAAAIGTSPFSDFWQSAEQTITAGGALTIAHDLGAVPVLLSYELKCTSNDLGYTTGELVDLSASNSSSNSAIQWGITSKYDASNIGVRFGSSGITIGHASTGARGTITDAKWKLIVRAWSAA